MEKYYYGFYKHINANDEETIHAVFVDNISNPTEFRSKCGITDFKKTNKINVNKEKAVSNLVEADSIEEAKDNLTDEQTACIMNTLAYLIKYYEKNDNISVCESC